MQVLKPKIRSKILEIAEKHFYKNGYTNTSLRKVADEVNMSVSNLYRYYENKEAIFTAVIGEYYNDFINNYLKHISYKGDEFNPYLVMRISDVIFEAVQSDRIKFIIIMDKSDKTEYSEFKDGIIEVLKESIRNGVKDHYKAEYILSVIARNFFDGILEIIKNCKDDDNMHLNMRFLVDYHMNGISSMYKYV